LLTDIVCFIFILLSQESDTCSLRLVQVIDAVVYEITEMFFFLSSKQKQKTISAHQ